MSQFYVVFRSRGAAAIVILRTVQDPNQATMAFSEERSRLLRAQAQGELQLIQQNGETHALLRETLAHAPLHPLRFQDPYPEAIDQ